MQLPAANGQVWPAAPSAAGDPSHQPAGRRIPVLQAPERRRALQQPAHRNATRQESLGGRLSVTEKKKKERKKKKMQLCAHTASFAQKLQTMLSPN